MAGYRVYQSGSLIGSTALTNYANTGLTANVQYCYTVAAYDNAGNVSAQTVQVCAVTQDTSSSSQPWSKRFGSTAGDSGQAVAFDANGNMYATGNFQGTTNFGCGAVSSNGASYSDVFLAKYSSDGSCLWSKRLGGLYGDRGTGVTVDISNNVIVAGIVDGYVSGTTVDFGGGPVAIYRDPNIFVAKYAADGTYQWAKTFGSSSGGSQNQPNAVAVNASGEVAVTGSFQNTINFGGGAITANGVPSIFVVKLAATGAHLWSKGMGSTGPDYGRGVAFDPSGNVVVTGSFNYGSPGPDSVNFGCGAMTSVGGDDIFVVKYAPSGSCLWSRQFGDSYQQNAQAVATDASGNILLTGAFFGTLNFGGSNLVNTNFMFPDILIAKLNASGGHIWSKGIGSTSSDQGVGIAVDSSGNAVVAGFFLGTVEFGGGPLAAGWGVTTFVARYASANGAYQSARAFPGTDSNRANGVAVDRNGNVGVAGYFGGTVDFGQGGLTSAGGLDGFLLKLAP